MSTPYRNAEIRPESTPLRLSWWSLVTSVLVTAFTAALAYVLFRYVAKGWVGYTVAGLVAVIAALFARGIGAGKVGTCPRCGTEVEVGASGPHGYPCPSCETYLDVDRGQLIVTPSTRVANRPRFAVEAAGELALPDCCCVCSAPTTKRVSTRVGRGTFDVPYCAQHSHGLVGDSSSGTVLFRSYPYALRVAEASQGRIVARKPRHSGDTRWIAFGATLLMGGLAAGTYWGLAALDRSGYEIVPASLKGLVLWLVLKLLGRLWVTAIFATLAATFFGVFVGSFKRRPASAR